MAGAVAGAAFAISKIAESGLSTIAVQEFAKGFSLALGGNQIARQLLDKL